MSVSLLLFANTRFLTGSWDGLVSRVTRLWAGCPGVWFLVGARDFSLLQNVSLALQPTKPPTQCIQEVLYPGVKKLWCEAEQSPSPNAEIKNGWNCSYIPLYTLWHWWKLYLSHFLLLTTLTIFSSLLTRMLMDDLLDISYHQYLIKTDAQFQ